MRLLFALYPGNLQYSNTIFKLIISEHHKNCIYLKYKLFFIWNRLLELSSGYSTQSSRNFFCVDIELRYDLIHQVYTYSSKYLDGLSVHRAQVSAILFFYIFKYISISVS